LSDEPKQEPGEPPHLQHILARSGLAGESQVNLIRGEPLPIEIGLFSGQWLGRYSGTSSGILVIDLDDMGTHYEGRACAYDDNTALPSTFLLLNTPNKENNIHLRLPLSPIDPRTGEPTTWNQLAPTFPNVAFPLYADVDLNISGPTLKVYWKTNIETYGSAEITRSQSDAPTEYEPLPDVTNWEQFKIYVSRLEYRRYIFRGQVSPLRLRTSFHRTGTRPG
jgi:hypothetical protein